MSSVPKLTTSAYAGYRWAPVLRGESLPEPVQNHVWHRADEITKTTRTRTREYPIEFPDDVFGGFLKILPC